MITEKAGKDAGKLITSSSLMELLNVTATLENSLAVFLKTDHAITLQPSDCTCQHLFPRNENFFVGRNWYITVYSSFIPSNQKPAIKQTCFTEYMTEQTMVHAYHGLLLSHQRYQLLSAAIWMNFKEITKSEKNLQRILIVRFHLCDISETTQLQRWRTDQQSPKVQDGEERWVQL